MMTYAHKNGAAETPRSKIDAAYKRNKNRTWGVTSLVYQDKWPSTCRPLYLMTRERKDSGSHPGTTHAALSYEALCLVFTHLMCQRVVTTAQWNDSLSLWPSRVGPRGPCRIHTASFSPTLRILVVQKDTTISSLALSQKYSRSRCHSSCCIVFVKLKGMFRKRIGWEKWYLIAVHRCAIPWGKQEMWFTSCIYNRVLEARGRITSSKLSGMGEGVGMSWLFPLIEASQSSKNLKHEIIFKNRVSFYFFYSVLPLKKNPRFTFECLQLDKDLNSVYCISTLSLCWLNAKLLQGKWPKSVQMVGRNQPEILS